MRISTYALATALAALALAVPASAQRIEQTKNTQESIRSSSGAASKNQEKSAEQQAADKLSTGRQLQLSKKARNAIVELQNAVIANDRASIPAKLAAAQALAETNDDKYAIAINQIKAATNANDLPAMRAGIDALQASGGADKADVVARYNNLGKRYYDAKSLDQAAASFEQALAVDANNGDALKMLASTREGQGRGADAATLMAKSIAATKAAGAKPKEGDYKFAARVAYDAKAPAAGEITRAWLADYPTAANWHQALRIYRDVNSLQGQQLLDVMRLANAANALSGDGDYFGYVNELITRGYLNEAKTVIAEGGAKKAIDLNKPAFSQFAPKLAKAPTRAAIDAASKAALAGGPAKNAMEAGDTLYGIGAYAQAASLYKAAASRPGVDANTANLHLGMALARSGDKAGATAALNAVTGPQANLAKYWLILLNSQG
jgi:Tfp pilus assembly protein PilF